MTNIDYSEVLLLTTKELPEWVRNGLSFKKNLKRKVTQMKDSIKARRGISEKDYRALLVDRERRMKLIKMARPILMDNEKLERLGASKDTQLNLYGDIQKSDELNDGLTIAENALRVLSEAVFTHGLTRDEFRRGAKEFNMSLTDLEKAEMCIDWVIWRLRPYLESLALRFGFREAEDLDEVRMGAILEVLDERLTYHAPAPGKGGYQWLVTHEEAGRMVRFFPNVAHLIREGVRG